MLFLQRKNNYSFKFHDEQITPIKIFLQGKLLFLIAPKPELIVRCLSFSADLQTCCVTTRIEHTHVHVRHWCLYSKLQITKGENSTENVELPRYFKASNK